jgi:hypothetical protein
MTGSASLWADLRKSKEESIKDLMSASQLDMPALIGFFHVCGTVLRCTSTSSLLGLDEENVNILGDVPVLLDVGLFPFSLVFSLPCTRQRERFLKKIPQKKS